MFIRKENKKVICEQLFQSGVMWAKKNLFLPVHPEMPVANIEVIKLMKSFTSKKYVEELFNWQTYYWKLTKEGHEYLQGFLNTPSDVVPNTWKPTNEEAAGGAQYGSFGGDRDGGGFGDRAGGRGRGRGYGDRYGGGGRGGGRGFGDRGGDRAGGGFRGGYRDSRGGGGGGGFGSARMGGGRGGAPYQPAFAGGAGRGGGGGGGFGRGREAGRGGGGRGY